MRNKHNTVSYIRVPMNLGNLFPGQKLAIVFLVMLLDFVHIIHHILVVSVINYSLEIENVSLLRDQMVSELSSMST
jgi:hypothetical protein